MDMLARREHSRAELYNKLMGKGCDAGLAGEAVTALAADGLVSDERFTEALYNNRLERGYGPLRIVRELRERGVDQAIVERWVDFGDREWVRRLAALRRRKYGAEVPREWRERARQMRFLQSRGFTRDQIERVMGEDWDAV